MRNFSFPTSYADFVEGELAAAVETVRQDLYRRSQGLPPKIADVFLHPDRPGITLVEFDVPPDPATVDATFTDRSDAARRTPWP